MSKFARVVVASNRAAAGVYPDRTGPVIVDWLRERGFEVPEPVVVPDGDPVAVALRAAVADGVAVVLTTGGTGVTPTDRTPEATRSVLDYEIPGIADAVRAAGLPKVPTAVLSRGLSGVAGRTLVVNLPGSTGGVKDGLSVLAGVLDHAVDQLGGGDHVQAVEQSSLQAAPEEALSSSAVVLRAEISETPVSAAEHAALVSDRTAGAVVTFEGVVRDHDHGRGVVELEYSGHPSAKDVIAEVAAEVAARHPEVRALAVSHRLGHLAIGDVALACAVSAAHRREAFVVCAELVDEVKAKLPVWKRQVFVDGTDEWVNCP
ncbi:molybdenum cofactor biosynthesis protein MoaE [Kutzneria buriramensis]|uniref:Molybdenum cofactor synthesis domain-containing protein n=1 Tax=Kutzneria buriramensis TaxID=1045776 RepID=A0A3E0GV94_9PSEU|nr:molybdenum cofactor biosynthesis protein MoaE [Kutzneria buriramensis]REH29391.1 molybdenum cofactor synthesis domain-containing protein [Kutzneria buriramensis]